ncbi:Elp3 domain-containing protein [Clostridiaceae bacterium BL-3]|nr:Elp3 domain-containing protein [Clostridiaceae bacterium BL-3]
MLNEISIEVIRKCPNNCLHCSSCSSLNCKEIISFDKFIQVIDGAIKLGLKTVCFSGGEPFLHPNIIDMINYVYEKKLSSYVYTSGIFINNNEKSSSIPKKIFKEICGKVSKLIFNIEAADPEIYNIIMGTKDNFEFLKESVSNAVKLGIVSEAHFVPMKLNVNQIEKVIDLCDKLNISKVSFLRLVLHGRALNNRDKIALSYKQTQKLIEKLKFIKRNKSIDIRIGVPLSDNQSENKCEAANGKLNIKYNGYVYPCEVFKNNRVRLKENLVPESINEKDIESIYKNSSYLNNVREYVERFPKLSTCENCVGQYFIEFFIKEDDSNG